MDWEEKLGDDLVKKLLECSNDDRIEFRAYFDDLNSDDEKKVLRIARELAERYHIGHIGVSNYVYDMEKDGEKRFVGWYMDCSMRAEYVKALAKDGHIKKLDSDTRRFLID